jgi:hypothetical protein
MRALVEQGLTTCRELGTSLDLAVALVMNLLYLLRDGIREGVLLAKEALALCEKNSDKLMTVVTLTRWEHSLNPKRPGR